MNAVFSSILNFHNLMKWLKNGETSILKQEKWKVTPETIWFFFFPCENRSDFSGHNLLKLSNFPQFITFLRCCFVGSYFLLLILIKHVWYKDRNWEEMSIARLYEITFQIKKKKWSLPVLKKKRKKKVSVLDLSWAQILEQT